MFFSKIIESLGRIEHRITELENAVHASNDAAHDIITAYNMDKPSPFQLDDTKMQEGISNLMGYDPFKKKEGDK